MNLNKISLAVALSALPITSVFAAALERSNQSISAFLEPGNYIEAGFNVTDTNIKGKTTSAVIGSYSSPSNSTYDRANNKDLENAGNTYFTPKINAKIQATERFSIGLMYDEPYGIETNLIQKNPDPIGYFNYNDPGQVARNTFGTQKHTSIDISTKSLSLLIGYQPTTTWNIYAGITNQQLDGSVFLRGTHIGVTAQIGQSHIYNATFNDKDALGWLTGLAYTNDTHNLKASLTYRSEIKHKFISNELDHLNSTGVVAGNPINAAILAEANKTMETQSTFKTPQSANFELSKAISDKTTSSLGIRWIDWSNAGLHLPFYEAKSKIHNLGPAGGSLNTPPENEYRRSKNSGYDILRYNKDQWSVDLGLDHKLTDKWKVNGSLGWDSGVGYVSNLTPESGSISAGVGVQYSPASNYFVQAGFKYYWLKDVKGQHSKQVSDNLDRNDTLFENNNALSYDFKIGYRF